MEKSNFDQLLHRYLTGQVTEQERIKIEAWLEENKSEGNTDLELSKDDEEKIFQRISAKHGLGKSISRKKPNGLWLFKVAASILIVALASYSAWLYLDKPSEKANFAFHDGDDRLILEDGTLVWLHENTDISYFEKQQGDTTFRFARIKGEALFEVAKDESKPFIIESGEVRIRVVGTSFNLKADDNKIELSLLTGKVHMSTAQSSIHVEPNEKVIYKGSGEFEKITLTKSEEKSIVADTDYKMAFTDAPMSDIVRSMKRKFGASFSIQNEKINNCRISIDLTDRSLEKSLQLISDVLHVEFTVEGRNVTLSGSGCD
jgi:ferric-dicitrate binding protein FerR (iron transport regulator)